MDTDSEFQLQYFRTLLEESDRGAVLLEASRLDDLLKDLHRTHIKSTSGAPQKFLKSLFETHAPLSTFAARIQLGYGFGLVHRDDYLDLECLRKLRNDVAHSTSEFSFRCAEMRTRVFALTAPKRIQQTFPHFPLTPQELEAANTPADDEKTAKLYLILSGMSLSMVLLARTAKILQYEYQELEGRPES